MTEQENKSLDAVSIWLKRSAENKGWKYFNYSQKVDFATLWEIGTGAGERDKTSPLLIDWNGFPSQHSLFPKIVEFITPFDWALAVAYDRVEANPQATSLPQVVIVDRCSHRYPGSFAVEMRRAMADALPHVHIFSALGNDGEDALEFVEFLKKSIPTATRNLRLGQMRALRQAWIGYTVQSGDHHDLSNLLGPLVLASATGAALPSLQGELVTALWQITKWFHLHADGKKDEKGSPEPVLSNVTKAIKEAIKEPVDFLLIDDMADLGWADCVANLLGIDNVASLDSNESSDGLGKNEKRLIKAKTPYAFFPNLQDLCKSPDPIGINSIMPLCGQGDTKEQALAYIPLSPNIINPSHQQIVFIDLRLFARSVSEERKFLSVSVRAALAMIGEDSFVRRWSDERFTKKRLGELQGKIDDPTKDWEAFRREEESCYLEALSLFIRLLAQRYFTLPLVLFSSTGKRKVLEYLKPYGNVISAFDKPRIVGDAIEVEAALNGFKEAMLSAAKLIRFRSDLQKILLFSGKPTTLPKITPEKSAPHVEVYFDETKDEDKKEFAAIAIVLIYASQNKAEELNTTMGITQTLIEKSFLRWIGNGKILKKLKGFKNESALVADAVSAFNTLFEGDYVLKSSDNKCGIFGIAVRRPIDLVAWELEGVSRLDGIYNQMLRYTTEAVIYELIPEILGSNDYSWQAFYANRIRPKGVKKDANNIDETILFQPNELKAIEADWGIGEIKDKPGYLRTYGKASFRTLVQEIIDVRKHKDRAQPKLMGAVGVGINNDPKWPRHVHGLADWFAFLLGQDKQAWLKDLIPVQIKQRLNESARGALIAARMVWQGKLSAALVECLQAPAFKIKNINEDPLSRILIKRVLGELMPALTGEDVVEALRKIAEAGTSTVASGSQKPNRTAPISALPAKPLFISDDLQQQVQPPSFSTEAFPLVADSDSAHNVVKGSPHVWPVDELPKDFELAQVDETDGMGFFIRNEQGGRYGYCHCSSDDLPKRNDFVIVSWKNWRSDTKEGFSLAEYEAPYSTVEVASASLDGSNLDTELAKLNEQPAEQGSGDVIEELPLGKNELRIKFKGSVCEGGVAYAVLALEDGKPCALLPMANNQVAECEIGQIVVVKTMGSSRHAKVSHSEYKLSVLEFAGLGRSST